MVNSNNTNPKEKTSILNIVENKNLNNSTEHLRVEKKRWKILSYIKEHPYSSIYKIGKSTSTNYSQMHSIIRELIFVRLISSVKRKSSNTKWYDVYFIPEKEESTKK